MGMRAPWIKNPTFDVKLRVSSLIDVSARNWYLQALQEVFVPADVELILASKPTPSKHDSFV